MNILPTEVNDVLIIEPKIFQDNRGFFMESWNQKLFNDAVGREIIFVQDNHSRSSIGVLRGLHYQNPVAQGKLIRVIEGEILDVAVDIRKNSSTFGKYVAINLSANNYRQLWVPEGCAHGFLVKSKVAQILYKATNYYSFENEHCIMWDDKDLKIDWELTGDPVLSKRDQNGTEFQNSIFF